MGMELDKLWNTAKDMAWLYVFNITIYKHYIDTCNVFLNWHHMQTMA